MKDGGCWACFKPMKGKGQLVDTRDDQIVAVGPSCFKKVKASGELGYQPHKSSPIRLYEINKGE